MANTNRPNKRHTQLHPHHVVMQGQQATAVPAVIGPRGYAPRPAKRGTKPFNPNR